LIAILSSTHVYKLGTHNGSFGLFKLYNYLFGHDSVDAHTKETLIFTVASTTTAIYYTFNFFTRRLGYNLPLVSIFKKRIFKTKQNKKGIKSRKNGCGDIKLWIYVVLTVGVLKRESRKEVGGSGDCLAGTAAAALLLRLATCPLLF
jgi:hypothetical protein